MDSLTSYFTRIKSNATKQQVDLDHAHAVTLAGKATGNSRSGISFIHCCVFSRYWAIVR